MLPNTILMTNDGKDKNKATCVGDSEAPCFKPDTNNANNLKNFKIHQGQQVVLYSKIIEHLNNLWREGGNSVEYVKDNIFKDIDVMMKDAGIIITDEVRHQIEYKTTIIFLAKYKYDGLCEHLKKLKEKSLKDFNKYAKKILEIQGELRLTTGKELFQLRCEIEKDSKELVPKKKKFVSCIPADELYVNPINIEREIEDNRRSSQIMQKYNQIESDQSRLSSNAVAGNADIFAINRDVEMFHIQRIQIPYSERLFEICRLAKQLRNRAVFVGRQTHFFRTRKNYPDLSKRYPDLAKRILAVMETKLDDPDLTDELKRKFENPALELSEKVRKALGKFEQFASLDEFLKFESVYKDLGVIYSPLPQQVLKYVASSWSSYYEGHASWVKNPKQFEAEPRIPSTRKKEKEFLISFPAGTAKTSFTNYEAQKKCYNESKKLTRRSEKRKDARYRISGEILLPLKFLENCPDFPVIRTIIDLKSIVEVRIVPKKCCYETQIVYKTQKTIKNLNDKKAFSIDIGANELIALTNNFGEQSILVRGRPVKAINQWMNKKIATLRSAQTHGITFEKGDELPETQEIARIRRKRDNIVNDYFHKTSRFVIERCLNSEAKNLAIGYNSGWKKDLLSKEDKRMGLKQRQSFAFIPFLKLIEMIRYKAELVGIKVVIICESYTSKCSSVDFEPIEHHDPDKYIGIRGVSRRGRNKKKLIEKGELEFKTYRARGLFKTKDGYLIHSDINASYNIGRKAFPKLFNKHVLSKRAMLKSPISVKIA